MKRALVIMACIILSLSMVSCTLIESLFNSVANKGYESVANKLPDAEFTFDIGGEERPLNYPLSTGRCYYVSSSYTGESDGSIEKPFTTLSEVNALQLVAGDSVLFKKGDTFKGNISFVSISGDDDNPITFASYGEGDAKPIIEAHSHGLSFEKCSNIVIRDLYVKVFGVDRMENPGDNRVGIRIYNAYVGEEKFRNIYIINNTVEGSGVSHNITGINIGSIEKDVASSPRNILDNVIVYGNEVFNVGRSGITSSGWLTNERINQNNTLMDLYRNFHFDNNYVHHVGCIGIYILGCTNSTINRNLIHDTGIYDVNQIMEGECGIMAIGTDTCDIMFNEIYNVYDQETGYDAMAIDIDWNTTNVNVQYNLCYNCQGSGIGTMANQNSFVRNNRIEDCQGDTNHQASIQVTNFTSRYPAVDESMHAVKNLLIEENLILHSVEGKSLFCVKPTNGDDTFENNVFQNNHLVYTGDEKVDVYFINVDPSLPWYKFANNKYYSNNTNIFKVLESTAAADINISEGAHPYKVDRANPFGAWQKRDTGSTYELINDEIPANPKNATVELVNGQLVLKWEANKGNVWHYNIFLVGEGEDVSYTKMLGETKDRIFTYGDLYKGEYYFIIQPESDTGVYGQALKVKVTLE